MSYYKQVEGGSQTGKIMAYNGVCDYCGEECDDELFDVRPPGIPAWGYFCRDCFESAGCNLGYGHGQRYVAVDESEVTEDNEI